MSTREENAITRMFAWWNKAYEDNAFTETGFAEFFTEDAPFVVNGNVRGTGPRQIAEHFQRIREKTDDVKLVTPVLATVADDTHGFVHYRSTFAAGDATGEEECLAVAELRDGKISSFKVIAYDD